jgi:hypothetical protein
MGIGTSLGMHFEDEHHYNSVLWDPKRFQGDELMETTPNNMITNRQLDNAELDPSSGMGIEVKYDTVLTPEEETKYKSLYGEDADKDYDMRGYFKANPDVNPNAPGVHYPDTYKKPNHPTFSDESIYNGVDGEQGGHWGNVNGKDTFTPGPTNLKNFGEDGLKDYFNRVEPDVELNLSGSK